MHIVTSSKGHDDLTNMPSTSDVRERPDDIIEWERDDGGDGLEMTCVDQDEELVK